MGKHGNFTFLLIYLKIPKMPFFLDGGSRWQKKKTEREHLTTSQSSVPLPLVCICYQVPLSHRYQETGQVSHV